MASSTITLDTQIAAQRNLLSRFVMYTPQWHAVNSDLASMVRKWRKTNILKAAK